jgi:tight adherence protein B
VKIVISLLVVVVTVAAAAMLRVTRSRARWRRVLGRGGAAGFVRGDARRRVVTALRLIPSGWRPAAVAAVGAGAGLAVAGPVAGTLLAVYGAAATRLIGRRLAERERARSRSVAVDAVAGLAADLRAGVPVGGAVDAAERTVRALSPAGAAPVVRRLTAAILLAESSGAPLADVLDRLDMHLRAIDRARAVAAAQAAGVRASAALLAGMPLAGLGLGYLMGVDALHIVLRTTIGATCALAAAALQLVGLAWTGRLSRIEVPA